MKNELFEKHRNECKIKCPNDLGCSSVCDKIWDKAWNASYEVAWKTAWKESRQAYEEEQAKKRCGNCKHLYEEDSTCDELVEHIPNIKVDKDFYCKYHEYEEEGK